MKGALTLPISGLNGLIVRQLYDACCNKLHRAFPNHNVKCGGAPFRGAPFPLLDQKHLERDPEAQVTRSWSRMLPYGMRVLGPAQREVDIFVCRRLGLDVALLAAACEKWDNPLPPGSKWKTQGERALDVHHGFVRRLLVGMFGVSIPDAYILPKFENGDAEVMLLKTFPELKKLPSGLLHTFLERQKEVTHSYFLSSTGQNEPLYLDAKLNVDQMFDQIVDFIERQFVARRR